MTAAPAVSEPKRAWWWFRQIVSLVWAVSPIVTIGVDTPIVTAVAPMRVRTKVSFVVAGLSTGLWVVGLIGLSLTKENQAANGVSVIPLLLGACVASGYGLLTRNLVFGFTEDAERRAVILATQHLKHRDAARKIVHENPRLAHELGIGRPDVAGDYDDGGLVDVNHVPLEFLVRAGMDDALAQRIINVRERIGGFDSLADLEVNLDLTPQQLDPLADVLIFVRPIASGDADAAAPTPPPPGRRGGSSQRKA